MEDEQNSAGELWQEYRWVEIEFRTAEEMEGFVEDFKRLLMERRKERKRREEVLRLAEKQSGVPRPVVAKGVVAKAS